MALKILVGCKRVIDYAVKIRYGNLSNSVADPGSDAFLTPGSGMGKKSGAGFGIRYEQPGSYFLELRNHFLGFKYLRIRD
jgi:hypothetical protein